MQYAVIEGVSFGILDGVKSILKVNNNFEKIFMVGGGLKVFLDRVTFVFIK